MHWVGLRSLDQTYSVHIEVVAALFLLSGNSNNNHNHNHNRNNHNHNNKNKYADKFKRPQLKNMFIFQKETKRR